MSVFVVRVVSHLFAECVNVNYFYLSFTIIAAFSLLSLKSSSQLIQSKMIDNLHLLLLSILLQPGRNCEHEFTCASLLKPETISRCQFRKKPWAWWKVYRWILLQISWWFKQRLTLPVYQHYLNLFLINQRQKSDDLSP